MSPAMFDKAKIAARVVKGSGGTGVPRPKQAYAGLVLSLVLGEDVTRTFETAKIDRKLGRFLAAGSFSRLSCN